MACLISVNEINQPEDTGKISPQQMPGINGYTNSAIILEPMENTDVGTDVNRSVSKLPSLENSPIKTNPVNMEWKNVNLTTKEGEMILKDLSGSIYSGELTAIMGPSGAGKSSLLNVLSGFTRHKVSGQVLVNGSNRDMRSFRKLNCYILQDDYLLPRLTVRELVTIAANLKIPSHVPRNDKIRAVNDCLSVLGLTSVENKQANTLSGGQRKRLCIAQDLVSNPPLIFLDEPTSGLDSFSCLQCIQVFKYLAAEGRTIVCTIHQPSSKIFEIFDKLYMLSGGQCIYKGSRDELLPFLAQQGLHCPQYYNPADYVTEIAVGTYGDWNCKLIKAMNDRDSISCSVSETDPEKTFWKENISNKSMNLYSRNLNSAEMQQESAASQLVQGYATNSSNQFQVLFKRKILCMIREPMITFMKLIGNVVMGLLLGLFFYKIGEDASKVYNNACLLFCLSLMFIFTAETPMVLTFPMERKIFEREHMNSWYGTRMYYLATSTAEIPFMVPFPMILCSIVYWLSGQANSYFRYGLFLLSTVFTSLVSQSLGQLIGAANDVKQGVLIASVSSLPILLFSGFFAPMNTVPGYLSWVSYGSFSMYSFQSMILALYSLDRGFLTCNKNGTTCEFEDPQAIIKFLDMEGNLYVDYSALLGFYFIFSIATYLVLKFKVRRMF